MEKIKRVFLIVLDSMGIGGAEDEALFGDRDVNTLRSIVSSPFFYAPQMKRLGLFNIEGVECGEGVTEPRGAYARLREKSKGKDTTIGHWEIAGIVREEPLPTYPEGFPLSVIRELEKAFGRPILCNKPYSGTQVIHDYGRQHEETGGLIVYTSADSVLQIAAHEERVPVEELYDYCKKARKIMQGEHAVGRVIARPFLGVFPNYQRTPRRHDFSLEPTGETVLSLLDSHGFAAIGVGKIADIFAGQGISRSLGVNRDNRDGMEKTLALMDEDFTGLAFVNLVDFDMVYGHRRDVNGYAKAVTDFDSYLGKFLAKLGDGDVLMITADHGCDPMAKGTDHTRECVPWLICGKKITSNVNLGTLPTFSVIGATIADMFGLRLDTCGESVLEKILKV